MKSYRDKVVVITGSAGGIGYALAKQFGLNGAKVVVSDLSQERIDEAVSRLGGLGMDSDRFAEKVMVQLQSGGLYIVPHAYNRVRLDERHEAIAAAYDQFAPGYDGDDEFDVRTLIKTLS